MLARKKGRDGKSGMLGEGRNGRSEGDEEEGREMMLCEGEGRKGTKEMRWLARKGRDGRKGMLEDRR